MSFDRDFERFAGEHVQVRLSLPIGNQRNFVGVIEGVRDGAVALRTEKGEVLLPFYLNQAQGGVAVLAALNLAFDLAELPLAAGHQAAAQAAPSPSTAADPGSAHFVASLGVPV